MSLSGHLLNHHSKTLRVMTPFGESLPKREDISIHGPMSFSPSMHGNQAFPSFVNSMSYSNASLMNPEDISATLKMKLGPEFISERPGPSGGPKLTYVEGWKIINLANEVFGFNGWSSSVVSLNVDFLDTVESSGRFNVGVTAIVRVTLRDGAFHEDVGYGMMENQKSKGQALDKCKKEAVTDALKRSLRNFGNVLGNCLYDKSYAREVTKIKVPSVKLDPGSLYRRPELRPKQLESEAPSKQNAVAPTTEEKKPVLASKREERHRNAPSNSSLKMERDPPCSDMERPPQPTNNTITAQPNKLSSSHSRANNPLRKGTIEAVQAVLVQRGQEEKAQDDKVARHSLVERPGQASHPPQPPVPAPGQALPEVAPSDLDTAVVTPGDDDPYILNSEDEALWMACDAGDTDLGRPIYGDEPAGDEIEAMDVSVVGPSLYRLPTGPQSAHSGDQRSLAHRQSTVDPQPSTVSLMPPVLDPGIPSREATSRSTVSTERPSKSGAFVFPGGMPPADTARRSDSSARSILGSKRPAEGLERPPQRSISVPTPGVGHGLARGSPMGSGLLPDGINVSKRRRI